MNILIINGSLGGAHKNSSILLQHLEKSFSSIKVDSQNHTQVIHLIEKPERTHLEKALLWAHGFIFISGTYWDSWGSPMQQFLELSTEWEGREHFFSKPAAVVVSMHSVGGKGVLSRLQGVLVTMGCQIPPMSGVALSLATALAQKTSNQHGDDFWQLADLQVMTHNLCVSMKLNSEKKLEYKSWEVDRKNYLDIWVEPEGS